jgi:hypothetical protein
MNRRNRNIQARFLLIQRLYLQQIAGHNKGYIGEAKTAQNIPLSAKAIVYNPFVNDRLR